MNPNYTADHCKLEAKNILSNRISNIAISIDKIKHCLKCMGTSDPPLITLTYREVFQKFWEGPASFRKSLHTMLEKLEDAATHDSCLELFWKASDLQVTESMDEED